jgi:hypothetical protein
LIPPLDSDPLTAHLIFLCGFLVGHTDKTDAEENILPSSCFAIFLFPPFSIFHMFWSHSSNIGSLSEHRTCPTVSSPWTFLHKEFTQFVSNGTSEALMLTLYSTNMDLSYYCTFALMILSICLLPVFVPMTMNNDMTNEKGKKVEREGGREVGREEGRGDRCFQNATQHQNLPCILAFLF